MKASKSSTPSGSCQILTNLGNQLNTVGRFIEALEFWDRALATIPVFGMALGNRGRGLMSYANALYDSGHSGILLAVAHDAFSAAEAEDAFYENPNYTTARSGFENLKNQIAAQIDLAKTAKISGRRFSVGKTAAEKRYRRWCLENRLFINPLNDLGPLSSAARDVLSLPSITVNSATAHPPAIFGFFNQMKQEFVSARYFYFEGIQAQRVHFADREVLLFNTHDYPAYSLATERIRAAFRLAYSILDKIGFFVNDYFALEHNPKQVYFRSVWYEAKRAQPRLLLESFATCPNWPLRGLFWLSKDLFEEEFKHCTETDAAALDDLRNHLEHKYLQLHHDFGSPGLADRRPDTLTSRLCCNDFTTKALRLLKLARAALIYLSLAVHGCENNPSRVKTALSFRFLCGVGRTIGSGMTSNQPAANIRAFLAQCDVQGLTQRSSLWKVHQ